MPSIVLDSKDQRVAGKSCEDYFVPKDTMKTLINSSVHEFVKKIQIQLKFQNFHILDLFPQAK